MRIKEGEPATSLEILSHEALEQRGLAGPGLPDDVKVVKTVSLPDADQLAQIAPVGAAEDEAVLFAWHPLTVLERQRTGKAANDAVPAYATCPKPNPLLEPPAISYLASGRLGLSVIVRGRDLQSLCSERERS